MDITFPPITDSDLYRYIRYVVRGVRIDRDHWSYALTRTERRAQYRYLERSHVAGVHADELAQELGSSCPWLGIQDSDDLFDWFSRTLGTRG